MLLIRLVRVPDRFRLFLSGILSFLFLFQPGLASAESATSTVPTPQTHVLPINPSQNPANQVETRVNETGAIPTKPSAPPSLFQKPAPETFRCQRLLVYEGRVLDCDSNVRHDGEMLRPIIGSVPEAVNELNLYQKNRIQLQGTAYAGSLGLLVLIAGAIGGGGLGKQLMLFGGGGILAGSFLYGILNLSANERHLGNAVELYNQAHPERPVRLEFSTRF